MFDKREMKLIKGFNKVKEYCKRKVVVEHTKEGDGASWRFASYREEQ